MKILSEELEELKELYKELKEHYDDVKRSRSPGVLEFISNQTKNLITLKTTIISLIKESANIKKIAKDIELKSNISAGGKDSAVLASLIKELITPSSQIAKFMEDRESSKIDYDKNKDMDSLLDKQLENTNDQYEEPEIIHMDESKCKIVFDEDKTQYLVDNEYNIIEDVEVPEVSVRFKRSKKTGERYAKDKKGNKYEIVDFDKLFN
jgi:hypothetical protein